MKILLIEDEVHLSEAVVHLLKQNNHSVVAVYDGEEGYYEIISGIYDIVVLDVMLPSLNGFEILKRVREEGYETPIIMLTARSQLNDKVSGLNFGADDYLTKPFATEELLARIKALGRRKNTTFEKDIIQLNDVSYNKDELKLFNDYKQVFLTQLESELFVLLFERLNMIISKEQIIVKLWGYESEAVDNNVEVYISFLRKKLRYISEQVQIKTTRGVGYSLEVLHV